MRFGVPLVVLLLIPALHAGEGKGRPFVGATFTNNRVVAVDAAGKIEWEVKVLAAMDVWRLADGRVLVASRAQGILEIGPDHMPRVLFKPAGETYTCQPLPGGGLLVGDNRGRRLLELDKAGTIIKEIPLTGMAREHGFLRSARKTSEGRYLACHREDNVVREYDAQGKVVWEFKVAAPMSAVRLPGGNTLIGAPQGFIETDPAGKVVWQLDGKSIGAKGRGYGVQRLANGNTVACFEGGVYEVTPDRRLVWSLAGPVTAGLMCFQVGDPSRDEILR